MKTGLETLVKDLPDNTRAKLVQKLRISERTLYRWLENPGKLIGMDQDTIIKKVLDRHYKADHDMAKLRKPIRIPGQTPVTA